MPAGRALALVGELPTDAAVRSDGGWPASVELAALSAEIDHAILRATYALGGAKRGQIPKPLTIPRPTVERVERPEGDATPSKFADGMRPLVKMLRGF